ncbi:hypothetical protein [Streptohalobacillus salinus]|nr:hypothetical protein [Streptohalobacillus salinus]
MMEIIEAAIEAPFDNLLGTFIYLTAVIVITILSLTLLLFLIPNPLSARTKQILIGVLTFVVLIIWAIVVF